MTLDQLKKVVACSIPCNILDGRVSYSYEALCASAIATGTELPPKGETFAMLRSMGFSDFKSNGERKIAASFRSVLLISIPIWKRIEKQITAQIENEDSK